MAFKAALHQDVNRAFETARGIMGFIQILGLQVERQSAVAARIVGYLHVLGSLVGNGAVVTFTVQLNISF